MLSVGLEYDKHSHCSIFLVHWPVPIIIQVVKRPAQVSDVSYADSIPAVGTKRSVRDRLGSNADNFLSHGSDLNKRSVSLSFFILVSVVLT